MDMEQKQGGSTRMMENGDERVRDELEEGLLLPSQELFPIIKETPQGRVDADGINASNVISEFEDIGQQGIIGDGTLPSNRILLTRARKPTSSSESPPFFLPQHDIPFFTGREDELRHLENLLLNATGSCIAGIVGLTGTGGVGKSVLAYHFATMYQDRFPDGVIGLHVSGKQIDTLAQRFASLAGVEIDPQQGLTASEIMQLAFRQDPPHE